MTTVSLSSVTSNRVEWPDNKDFAIFIEEHEAVVLLPILIETFGSESITTILDRGQNAIGRVVIQGDVDITTAVPLSTGLLNLFTSRIMWLILPLLALEIFLIYRIRSEINLSALGSGYRSVRDILKQAPVKLKLGRARPQAPVKETSPSKTRSIEFGLFLRLGFKNVVRNFQAKIVLGHQKDPITPDNKNDLE
jgi:hypothetical protein